MAYNRSSKHRGNNNYKSYEDRNRNKKVSKVHVPEGKRPSHVTVVARPNEDPMQTIKRFLKQCKKEKIVEQISEDWKKRIKREQFRSYSANKKSNLTREWRFTNAVTIYL